MRADLILTNIKLIKIMISLLLLQNLIKFHNKLEELNKIKAMLKKCGTKQIGTHTASDIYNKL